MQNERGRRVEVMDCMNGQSTRMHASFVNDVSVPFQSSRLGANIYSTRAPSTKNGCYDGEHVTESTWRSMSRRNGLDGTYSRCKAIPGQTYCTFSVSSRHILRLVLIWPHPYDTIPCIYLRSSSTSCLFSWWRSSSTVSTKLVLADVHSY